MTQNRKRLNWLTCTTVLAAAGFLAIGGSNGAFASAGCDQVNDGAFNKTEQIGFNPTTITDFAAGDELTFEITVETSTGSAQWSLGSEEDNVSIFNIEYTSATTDTQSYTVTGEAVAPGGPDTTLNQVLNINTFRAKITVTATCTSN